MNKKIIIITVALWLPVSAIAFPVGDKCPDVNHGDKIKSLAKDLNLNDSQKTEMETLFKELHEKFKAMLNETHTKIQDILTPEQRAKLEEINRQQSGDDRQQN